MKQKRSYKKPSFYVISSAMDGDKISIDKILDFYDRIYQKAVFAHYMMNTEMYISLWIWS